jgi:hypothetical protein
VAIVKQAVWQAYTGQTWEDRDSGWENAVHSDHGERVQGIWKKALEDRTVYETRGGSGTPQHNSGGTMSRVACHC